jgi:hypothetical protein
MGSLASAMKVTLKKQTLAKKLVVTGNGGSPSTITNVKVLSNNQLFKGSPLSKTYHPNLEHRVNTAKPPRQLESLKHQKD